ncbi:FKBP-type peptidyl-prolyl cis-trans isomerase [Acinetobacter sp. MD2(2019)]|uniref:FKBP-type peptidyl-prolyl cis-trans isomerase n=1 Tax=Acinetobacter sp. MD2(2019) TaxID=2605273 RepID=UPI002D1F9992|nr:FKBP-type peptidyl-prolyl cis-trans isomerase [Acinetobacter sp. MD2(2019)]MEB3754416.1 FKBP-type peptidyl-prolyl cis-trans isomerase [Acinetobacter sp. MD2(2019)]
MKRILGLSSLLICSSLWAEPSQTLTEKKTNTNTTFESTSNNRPEHSTKPIDIISYAEGYRIGSEMPADVATDYFADGVRDGQKHDKPAYNDEQLKQAFITYQKEMQSKTNSLEELNKTFLANNAKKPGIKTTASGLQYQVLKEGTGKKPTRNSTVKVNYEGKLADGTVFDSSFKRNEPVEFPLKNVITGWQEGIPLIKEGGSIMLYIPAKLAYGAEGNVSIPPNSVLIFKVNLLRVK